MATVRASVFEPLPSESLIWGEFLPFSLIVFGLVVFSVLSFACVVVGVIVVFLWKVAREGWMYVLILILMLVGASLSLLPFIDCLRVFRQLENVDANVRISNFVYRHISGAPNVILFAILVVLAINLSFALWTLMGKEISSRGEKVFVAIVVVSAAVVVLPA